MEQQQTTTDTDTTPNRPRARTKRLTLADWITRLRDENPGAKAADLRAIAAAEVSTHTRTDYAFRSVHEQLIADAIRIHITDPREPRMASTTAEERAAAAALMRQGLNEVIEARAALVLMEFITESGKPLGECTGAECRKLSVRSRDFYAEIAKRLTPGEHVKNHLTEPELQAIWRVSRLEMKA